MLRFLINWLNAWRTRREVSAHVGVGDNLADLARLVQRGVGCWAARERGSCPSCGHEWIPGEIVGVVEQAYAKGDDGTVYRCPATRVVCGLCVETQRAVGDLSMRWAREAGLL